MFAAIIAIFLVAAAHGATTDGSVFAYDTPTATFVAVSDPIYYGSNTQANGGGLGSITLGVNASTVGAVNGIALGLRAKAAAARTLALGAQSLASGTNAMAFGQFAVSAANFGIAAGSQSSVASTAVEGIALGYIASVSKSGDIAIGAQANADGGSAIAFGQFAQADANHSIVIGSGASSNLVPNSVSLGTNAQPYAPAYALALSLNAASATTTALGITLNGAPRVVPIYGALYASQAGGGAVLTATSATLQVFTLAPQTVRLPLVSTLQRGQTYTIVNAAATGAIAIVSSGGNLKHSLPAKSVATLVCSATTGTDASSWMAFVGPTVV